MTKELTVAIVGGALAFLGAITGTYVSSYLEEERSDRQFMQQLRARILDKRISVVEQCTHARSQFGRAKTLMGYKEIEEARLAALAKTSAPLEKVAPSVYSIEMQREFAAIQSEHFACVQMATLLFGPKTAKAALDINTDTSSWLPDPNNEKLSTLYQTMISELAHFTGKGSP
jgi:hypothetical protein